RTSRRRATSSSTSASALRAPPATSPRSSAVDLREHRAKLVDLNRQPALGRRAVEKVQLAAAVAKPSLVRVVAHEPRRHGGVLRAFPKPDRTCDQRGQRIGIRLLLRAGGLRSIDLLPQDEDRQWKREQPVRRGLGWTHSAILNRASALCKPVRRQRTACYSKNTESEEEGACSELRPSSPCASPRCLRRLRRAIPTSPSGS